MSFQGATQGDQPSELAGVYFLGKVVDNDDPLKMERVKVRIPDVFEGDSANFPWCSPAKAGWFPNTAEFGVFGLVPPVGTEIKVLFQQGNPLYPLYFAYPHQKDERVNDFVTNYLKRYGWKDPQGNLFFIDTTNAANPQVKFQHTAGILFTIEPNGTFNITITGAGDKNVNINGGGAYNIHADGNVNVNNCDVIVSSGDVIADGISLKHHVHSGVQSGASNTDEPVG